MCREIAKTRGTTHRKTQGGNLKNNIFSEESGSSHFVLWRLWERQHNWLLETAVGWVSSLLPNSFVELLIYKCDDIWRWSHWEMSKSWNVTIMNGTGAWSNYQGRFFFSWLSSMWEDGHIYEHSFLPRTLDLLHLDIDFSRLQNRVNIHDQIWISHVLYYCWGS